MSDNTNLGENKNKKVQKNNTSGCTGVSWDESRGEWFARITFCGKTHYLGHYKLLNEAISARKTAERKLHTILRSAKTITI